MSAPRCESCGKPATCYGSDPPRDSAAEYSCDDCCAHGDHCVAVAPCDHCADGFHSACKADDGERCACEVCGGSKRVAELPAGVVVLVADLESLRAQLAAAERERQGIAEALAKYEAEASITTREAALADQTPWPWNDSLRAATSSTQTLATESAQPPTPCGDAGADRAG